MSQYFTAPSWSISHPSIYLHHWIVSWGLGRPISYPQYAPFVHVCGLSSFFSRYTYSTIIMVMLWGSTPRTSSFTVQSHRCECNCMWRFTGIFPVLKPIFQIWTILNPTLPAAGSWIFNWGKNINIEKCYTRQSVAVTTLTFLRGTDNQAKLYKTPEYFRGNLKFNISNIYFEWFVPFLYNLLQLLNIFVFLPNALFYFHTADHYFQFLPTTCHFCPHFPFGVLTSNFSSSHRFFFRFFLQISTR